MRVVLAPDSFGAMPPDLAAETLAAGWRDVAPHDETVVAPLSDGGPGFVSVLAGSNPDWQVRAVTASGPTGSPRTGSIVVGDGVGYAESAQVCGLRQVQAGGGDVRTATTYGLGLLIAAAAAPDIETLVVGLGGSGTNDGGAGMWAALGAEPSTLLRGGGAALRQVSDVVGPEPLALRLIAATDVDNPLLGLHGAAAVFGPQKGADHAAVMELDACLERWADAVERATGRRGLRDTPGAGAAGGLGFGLLALGAELVSGVDLVIDRVGLAAKVAAADLVVTGEGRYDATSLRGKVVSGVARTAQAAGVPCVVAAGQSSVGAREAAAHGVDDVWSVADLLGSAAAALAAGTDGVREVGRAVARAWSR